MKLLPNDILIRNLADGETVWVSQRVIMERCGISEKLIRYNRTIYKQTLPNSWQKVSDKEEFFLGDSGKSWRWGRKGGQYYYDVDRIPNRKPCFYREMLPTKDELINSVEDRNLMCSRERMADAKRRLKNLAVEYYTKEDVDVINYDSEAFVDINTCREYAKALGWCRMITLLLQSGKYKEYGCVTMDEFYSVCADILSEMNYANLRVRTGRSLRNKLGTLPKDKDEQRQWIISGKYGNNNSMIVGKFKLVDTSTGELFEYDVHQAIMYHAYMNPDSPVKEKMRTLYDDTYVPMLQEFDIGTETKAVSYRAFCSHLTRLGSRLKFDLTRHGEDYYKKHLLTYTPSEKLSYSHSLFCADGSGTIGYRYWKEMKDEKGRKTQKLNPMNLYVMMITDVATGYIAGYDFAPEGYHCETLEMVQGAVRMAVKNGGNRTMFEMVSDNHGAFSSKPSKEYLNRVFERVRRIEKHNSQANPAETQFRLFKNGILRSMKNFIRTSHGVGVEGRANLDNVKVEDYPIYTDAIEQFKKAVDKWNNKVMGNGKTPKQMFTENKNPDCKPLEPEVLRLINGAETDLSLERMRGIIVPKGKYAEYKYEIPDYVGSGIQKIQKATGNGYDSKVTVVYDETGADLYSTDGKFILTCPVTGLAKMAQCEKTEAHKQAQLHHSHRKTDQLEQIEQVTYSVQRAYELLEGDLGYEANVRLGGSKETVNELFETYNALTIREQAEADRTLKKQQKREKRIAEKDIEQQNEEIQAAYQKNLKESFQQNFLK